ncbi:MAG: GNAT family N-acetyltransferase [Flavobacteriaceae bacterium]
MKVSFENISAADTLPLRQALLRPGKPLAGCQFDKDNHSYTLHWGAFVNNKLVGILSAMNTPCESFPEKNAYQFRGMAVASDFQRKGIATQLLQSAEKQLLINRTPELFWLNARIKAIELYTALAYQPIGPEFDIPTVGPHQRFFKNNLFL